MKREVNSYGDIALLFVILLYGKLSIWFNSWKYNSIETFDDSANFEVRKDTMVTFGVFDTLPRNKWHFAVTWQWQKIKNGSYWGNDWNWNAFLTMRPYMWVNTSCSATQIKKTRSKKQMSSVRWSWIYEHWVSI